jgi:hypothetical protein
MLTSLFCVNYLEQCKCKAIPVQALRVPRSWGSQLQYPSRAEVLKYYKNLGTTLKFRGD